MQRICCFCACAVKEIIYERMPDISHMHSYLMGSAGVRYDLDKRISKFIGGEKLVFGNARLSVLSNDAFNTAFLLASYRRVYNSVWLGYAFDYGKIRLFKSSVL